MKKLQKEDPDRFPPGPLDQLIASWRGQADVGGGVGFPAGVLVATAEQQHHIQRGARAQSSAAAASGLAVQ